MNLDLFSNDPLENLLPYDGELYDYGTLLFVQQATDDFQCFLTELPWQPDEVFLYGKYIQTARKLVWYGDDNFKYSYSGTTKAAQVWDAKILALKQKIEEKLGSQFNSCLVNLYENGTQAMGWHSDNEPELKKDANANIVIASLSLGATRKFCLKHNMTRERVEILLEHGQLIVMKGQTQQYWKHCLTKTTKVSQPRINLTFRYFYVK